MNKVELPSYSALVAELNQNQIELHPSQLHGIFCGLLAGQKEQSADWQKALATTSKSVTPLKDSLQSLYDLSQQQLKEFLFEFELLLPSDDDKLPQRAEALTLWCQGFLTGLKFTGVNPEKHADKEVAETVSDLIEIAKMNYEDVVDTEEDEEAYIELIEYVRMAAILIYQTIQNPDNVKVTRTSNNLH